MKLNELIRNKNLSKTKIAEKLEIARPTLDDYIKGNTSITVEKLEKLFTILNVLIASFLLIL